MNDGTISKIFCTPITPSRGTKLWEDTATDRAIGVPSIVEMLRQPPPREVGEAIKTALLEARAARHHARQHAGLARRNLKDLILSGVAG